MYKQCKVINTRKNVRGVLSQAQLSLDNSGMHIFRASGAITWLAPSLLLLPSMAPFFEFCLWNQFLLKQLLAISVFSLALLCRPLERVLGPQNDPQRITKGSSGIKAHCLSVTRAAPEHISMNESSCRSLGPRLLERLLSSSPFPQVPKFPDSRCAQTFWALTSSSESNSELDSGLLLNYWLWVGELDYSSPS